MSVFYLPPPAVGATVHGSYQGSVVIEDEEGQGAIPLSILERARKLAENRDSDVSTVYGRQYHRDALILADDTANALGLVELPSCHVCVDVAAIDTDHKDRPVCLTHVPTEG